MTDPRSEEVVSDQSTNEIELDPRPRVMRLNKRAFLLGLALLSAVVVAAALTLSEVNTRMEEQAEESSVGASAPDPFWTDEPDGVAQPEVEIEAAPPIIGEDPPTEFPILEPTASPVLMPVARVDDAERERLAKLKRAMEAAPAVPAFQHTRATPSLGSAPSAYSDAAATDLAAMNLEAIRSAQDLSSEPDALVKQNQQEEKRAFLEEAVLGREDEANPNQVRAPASPYAVMAGSLVPAVLVTGANSDLPGALTARVRENVYDTATGGQLLIPQGTLLVGQYDSTVTYGQERLLVAWQRMIFPDGSSLNLGSMPGVDHAGASGFKDRVNNHYVRIFGSAFLLSAISAGLQISQGDSGSSEGDDGQNIRQTLAAALGQNLGEVSTEMVRRNMQIQPRIEIRAGYRFNVFVNRDLLMPGPYASS